MLGVRLKVKVRVRVRVGVRVRVRACGTKDQDGGSLSRKLFIAFRKLIHHTLTLQLCSYKGW